MFVRIIKYLLQRLLVLILFCKDFKILICCFTILTATILSLKPLEECIYNGKEVQILKIIPIFLIVCASFFVSQGSWRRVHKLSLVLLRSFLLIFLLFVNFWYLQEKKRGELQNIHSFIGKQVALEGHIISQEGEGRYILRPKQRNVGNILLKTKEYSVIRPGNSCKIRGKLVEPKSFDEFDYKKYLFRKGVYSILELEMYDCSDKGINILNIRSRIERILNKSISEPESSLLVGILFGSKRVFTEKFNISLQASGLSHIISASGYNVSLLASFVDSMFGKLRSKFVYILKISFIWIFAIFAGFSPSIVRASTMSSIYFLSLFLGRDISKGVLIIFCITVLVIASPFILYDIGFLLSSSSTLGLIFLPKCFNFRSSWIKDSLLPTITCAICTLPIVIYFFRKVSIVSIISNLLAAPVIQSTIYFGLIAILFNLITDKFQFVFFFPYVQLNIFKYIVEISSKVRPLEVQLDASKLSYLIVSVIVLFCLLKYPISNENYYLKKSKSIIR